MKRSSSVRQRCGLYHFILLVPVDLICIQTFFLGFAALRSDRSHSQSVSVNRMLVMDS